MSHVAERLGLMKTRIAGRHDPAIRRVLDDGGLDGPFDGEFTELVVIGEEEGVPVGFAAGRCAVVDEIEATSQWVPVLEQVAIRPGFQRPERFVALATAFADALRGFPVVANVDPRAPSAPHTRQLLTAWGATMYRADDTREWWIRRLPSVSAEMTGPSRFVLEEREEKF